MSWTLEIAVRQRALMFGVWSRERHFKGVSPVPQTSARTPPLEAKKCNYCAMHMSFVIS